MAHNWLDDQPRALREAARCARARADAEALPIAKIPAANNDLWYCQSLLAQGAVSGTHAAMRTPQTVQSCHTQGLKLSPEASFLFGVAEPGPVWRDLFVEKAAYEAYLSWLRSFW